jgi:hypothetical protein
MNACSSSPSHSDGDLSFSIDRPVSVSFDGDAETVQELCDLITRHYRKPGGQKVTGGRDSSRNVPGGFSVRFTVYGK